MRFFYILTFLLFYSLGLTQNTLKFNLNDVIKIAVDQNVFIKQVENNLSLAKSDLLNSYGNILPNLNASANFSWTRSEDEGGVLTFGGLTIPLPPTRVESRSYSTGISSNLTLFDGLSSFYSIYQSKTSLESSQKKLERIKQDIVFQAIVKYVNLLKAKKLLAIQEENLKWNKKSLETIIERNRVGQLTLADVYQQQVNFGNAELLLIQARNNYESLKNDLISFLNLDVALPYEFEDLSLELNLINQSQEILNQHFDFNQLVQQALENRADYHARYLDVLSNQYAISIARGAYFPRLVASINASMRANRLSDLDKSRTYIASLSLSVPIFNGWTIANRVQLAQVNYKNNKLQLDEFVKELKINIKKALLDLDAVRKKLEVNSKNVLAAEENKKINEEKYLLGANTLLNLLIANSQHVQAQNELINSTYDYLILKKQIEYLTGILETEY